MCTVIFISGSVCTHQSFPGWNGNQHPEYSDWDTQQHQGKYLDFLACGLHWSVEQKAALEFLHPSEKADHKTVLEEQGLKHKECTARTCLKILEDITKRANDCSSASLHVFWLTSQASSSKTTIAYTIAKQFEEDGNTTQQTILGGNFLCLRQFQEIQTQTCILPTITYQLACKCKSYANALHVTNKFNIVNYDISAQMKSLLVGPWQHPKPTCHPEPPPYLIVIDALNEIMGNGGLTFLCNLLDAVDNLQGLKFLVMSQSNLEFVKLCKAFTSEAVCYLQDMPIKEVKTDIKTYLETKLPMLASSPELAKLGQHAGGLFIYAAMAVKYLTLLDLIMVESRLRCLTSSFPNYLNQLLQAMLYP